LMYYEYLYNFKVHLNFLKFDGECLYYLPKSSTSLDEFRVIQDFFYESLQKGHVQLINDLLPQMMQGFEWSGSFPVKKAPDLKALAIDQIQIPSPAAPQPPAQTEESIRQLIS